jgi:long-chain acyl-CoA synthetase
MNLAAVVEPHPADRVALVERDRVVTYGELRRRLGLLRGALAARGVGRGDRVAVVGPNGIELVEAFLAVLGLGAVVVPLNPQSPPAELEREREAVGVTEVLSTSAGEIDELLGAGHPLVPIVDVDPGDVAVLCFTSGTAGAPRAAMLTHGSLVANVDQMSSGPDRLGPDDVVLGVLPLFHVFGFGVALDATMTAGARLVLASRFDPVGTLDLIRTTGVTVVLGAPPMWVAWSQLPEATPGAFASVRQALSGAAKLPEDVAASLEERLGVVVREGYGLTEASPVVTTSVGIAPRRGSVGKALDGVEVRLVDDDGTETLGGDPGEIWVRGPNVFAGYWDDAEATARVLTTDGWLRTGDIAVADDDGYLYIVDRVKDLIIVSGFNVYPAEVEQVLAEAPGVAEAGVVGVAHPTTGEAVRAYVVPTPGRADPVTEDTVIAWCRMHLARYKCPTSVLVVDALPKGLAGKLLRRALR